MSGRHTALACFVGTLRQWGPGGRPRLVALVLGAMVITPVAFGVSPAIAATAPYGIVSVTHDGVPGQGTSGVGGYTPVAASIDGSKIYFGSYSADLVPVTPTPPDVQVYVRDRTSQTTQRISLTPTGAPLNSTVLNFKVSHNDRYLAFNTSATKIGLGHDDGQWNLYLRDLTTGTITWHGTSQYYAVADNGTVYPNATAVTSDGHYVIPLDYWNSTVSVLDTQTGQTRLASSASDGTPGNGQSMPVMATISGDGRKVTFFSTATNLVPNYVSACAPNNCGAIYQKDMQTGVLTEITSDFANTGSELSQALASSDDGDLVAFCAIGSYQAANNGPDTLPTARVYVHSMSDGTTLDATKDNGQQLNPHQFDCPKALSGDGHTVVVVGNTDFSACDPIFSGCTPQPLQVYAEPVPTLGITDTTPPVVAGHADREPNAAGWYTEPVAITWTAVDDVDGALPSPPSVTLSTDGKDQAVTSAPACDTAGNCATETVTLSLDQTPPVVTVTGVTPGSNYTLGQVPAAGCSTTDATSGVATHSNVSVSRGDAGAYTVACAGAVDMATNTADTVTAAYTVTPTHDSLTTLTNSYVSASGAPNAAGVIASLDAKLANGNICGSRPGSFIGEVAKQASGPHPTLTTQQASELAYWAAILSGC